MGQSLFFEGAMRIGKSTQLRNFVNQQPAPFCGFEVVRIWQNNAVVGYQAVASQHTKSPQADAPYTKGMPNLFLYKGKANTALLAQVLAQTKQNIQPSTRFLLLDEIGGVELLYMPFMDTLFSLLALSLPIVGILKSAQNLNHLMAKFSLSEQNIYIKRYQTLRQHILKQGTIVNVTPQTVANMNNQMHAFLMHKALFKNIF